MRVLVVEDDVDMGPVLEQALREEGDSVVLAKDGVTGFELAKTNDFDVILLDVMLPGLDGFGVVHRLREQGCHTPVLMLTARDTIRDIVHGLNSGADDYLTKPFALEVLLARLRAVARRGGSPQKLVLRIADLTLNTASREVSRGNRAIELTRTEYGILEMLLRNSGRIVSRDQLIEAVWGYDAEIENATLDTFVHLLRRKVDPPGESKLIHTSRGVGYSIRVEH
ncbi:response regulator transcription factor [Bryobacter aggregatus]|uniref:response regulator transcription factor n=1 Tax=Bryobacter aggregatus TaxID=360054 RepID=UPI0004E16B88|nr:response regulator transcription factor [Bryobacter aggregatus]